jgi:hypothetical protein
VDGAGVGDGSDLDANASDCLNIRRGGMDIMVSTGLLVMGDNLDFLV